ncbi:hypothetical protein SXCC_00411 [Gluconacetobacter sp. SXCC-1]|nr:hypothetical protein SXCC_00411 [Gluconacetobacter sp. SXCC-1]
MFRICAETAQGSRGRQVCLISRAFRHCYIITFHISGGIEEPLVDALGS